MGETKQSYVHCFLGACAACFPLALGVVGLSAAPDPAGTNSLLLHPRGAKGRKGPLNRTRGKKGVSSSATPPQEEAADGERSWEGVAANT